MPDGDKNSSSPANGAGIRPAILSGKTWNSLLDKIAKITPRGSDSVSVKPSTSGSQIASGSGGGELSTTLPSKVENDSAAVLISGSTWNNLLDYIESITPRGSASIKCQETPTGSILSFITPTPTPPPVECEFDFYLNVTITGGSYPFTWNGLTWTESGQTLAMCGTGTQSATRQSWQYTAPPPGYYTLPDQAYFEAFSGITTAYQTAQKLELIFRKGANPSQFYLKLTLAYVNGLYISPYYSIPGYNKSTTSATGVASNLPASALGTIYNRLQSGMFGSLTTTGGRTITWQAAPDLPWDYDN